MKKVAYLFFGFSILLIFSCKKNEYSDTSPAPVYPFFFNGTINAVTTQLHAGENNYYLYTNYSPDANGVNDFTGEFRDRTTTSGSANSLKIILKDYRIYAVMSTNIDSSIIPGFVSFASPAGTPSSFTVQFHDTLYNDVSLSNNWNFGDGCTLIQHNPAHTYLRPGMYNASFDATGNIGSSALNNDVKCGQAGDAFLSSLFVSSVAGNAVNYGGFPNGVSWDLDWGDGNHTNSTGWPHTYANPGLYNAMLTVTGPTGYVEVTRKYGATQSNTTPYCDFSVLSSTPVSNPLNFSTVDIEWTDASGALYTSNDNSQPNNSSFKIISVDPYQNDINGHPTKKIHAVVSCMLYNGTNSIPFNGDVVFAVAYP